MEGNPRGWKRETRTAGGMGFVRAFHPHSQDQAGFVPGSVPGSMSGTALGPVSG